MGYPIGPGGQKWGTPSARWADGASLGLLEFPGRLPGASRAPPGAVLGRLGAKKVPNMAPSWPPKWTQNGLKIEAKIDQNLDASWDRFWGGFWGIWGAKMEPCWPPNGAQNGSYVETTEKRKNIEKPIEFQ